MQESEKKTVLESFRAVMPYLVYPDDLKEFISRLAKESPSLREFQSRLEEATSTERDPTRKTDKQILLNELRKRGERF